MILLTNYIRYIYQVSKSVSKLFLKREEEEERVRNKEKERIWEVYGNGKNITRKVYEVSAFEVNNL